MDIDKETKDLIEKILHEIGYTPLSGTTGIGQYFVSLLLNNIESLEEMLILN